MLNFVSRHVHAWKNNQELSTERKKYNAHKLFNSKLIVLNFRLHEFHTGVFFPTKPFEDLGSCLLSAGITIVISDLNVQFMLLSRLKNHVNIAMIVHKR